MSDPRQTLVAAIAAHGTSLEAVSRKMGRNPAYLHQFIHRGSPRRLGEIDRRNLSIILGVSERRLGALPPLTAPRISPTIPAT